MAKVPLDTLYKDLDDSIKTEQYKRTIEICDKILGAAENEKEALHCKIIAFIQLSQFEKALELLEKNPDELQFERAYCHYKLSSFEKARDLLAKLPPSSRLDQLTAQLNYRLGNYDTSIQTYNKILQQEDSNETKVNILANYASTSIPLNKDFYTQENLSFEYYYNLACCSIYRGDLSKGSELLDLAEKRCVETLKSQNVSEEEILDELAIIKVQMGYLLQLKGSPQLSSELYDSVLHSKVSDLTVSAIAANNLVSVNKDQKLFNAEKKLQSASNPAVDMKLTPQQRNIILFNRAICLLKMNKMEQCKEFIQQIEGNEEAKTIIQSAVLVKEKKVDEAIALLEKSKTLELKLSYAQWLFQDAKYEECLTVLQGLNESDLHRPAIVSFRTFLYQHLKNVEKANQCFDQAIDFWKNSNRTDLLLKLLKPATDFKMKYKFYESASDLYKLLIKFDESNRNAYVPLLVICLSHFNPIAAEEFSETIPPSVTFDQIDAEELENSSLNFRLPKQDANDEISILPSGDKLADRKKSKKKKKKKKRVPKNFNPMVIPDPERWLPRKDRSNYKRRKGPKKPVRGGHQGSDISLPVKVEENKPAVVVTQKQTPNKKAKKGRRR